LKDHYLSFFQIRLSKGRYWENPQFTFVLNESDVIKDNSCWVIISLMQKHTRQKRIELKVDTAEEYIQFRLYRVSYLCNLKEFSKRST